MRYFLGLILSVCFISCGTLYVQADYTKNLELEPYKTYNYDFVETGLNELDERRFVKAADSVLGSLGFTKSDTPQLYLTLFVEEVEVASNTNLGIGVGGGGGGVGVSLGGGIPVGSRKLQQQMTVKLWDATSNKLLWEAYGEGSKKFTMTPARRTEYMEKWVAKIFKKLPVPKN